MDKGIETNDKKRLIRRTSNCSGKRARFVTGRRTSVRIAKHSGTKRSLPPGNHLPASQLSRHQPVANPTKKKFATKVCKAYGHSLLLNDECNKVSACPSHRVPSGCWASTQNISTSFSLGSANSRAAAAAQSVRCGVTSCTRNLKCIRNRYINQSSQKCKTTLQPT